MSNIHPVSVPLVTKGVLLFLLLSCMMLSSLAESSPRFVKSPEDQIGVSGGVASFVCQAMGEPKPRITWKKNGKRVSSQRIEVIEFGDGSGSVLRIQPLRTHRDEALYECTVTNSVGEIRSNAKLTVLEERQLPHGFPTIDVDPQLRVVEKPWTATMLCAASGSPDPEISWYKDMLPVEINNSSGRIKQLRSGARGVLQIENSEESDQGKYECVATNMEGTRYSAPANLYVREQRPVRRVPPRFSVPPTNQEVMPGGNVSLTCVAVGSPLPYVKWMMGSEDLTEEYEIPLSQNVLEVTDIRQSANYTCVAMSSLGVIETTVEVTVRALPKPPTSLTVAETTATSVTLTWESGNHDPISYYLIQYKAKSSDNSFRQVQGMTTTRYSIEGLSPYSKYEFRVMAVNDIGRGPLSDPVEVLTGEQAPSSPPLRLKAHVLSDGTMLVQWEPPEEPNGVIIGYRVYYSADVAAPLSAWQNKNQDSSCTTLIEGLIPNTTYNLGVLGFTSVGDGPLSNILQVKTQQEVPAPPSSFEAQAEQDDRIMLTWLWPVQDPITKYELRYWEAGSETKIHKVIEPASSYVVDGLKPDTLYRFILAARSEVGLGLFTQPIEARTAQSMPEKPTMMVSMTMGDTALIQWQLPQEMLGEVIGYKLQYRRTDDEYFTSQEFQRTDDHYTVTGLHKGATYIFRLIVHNLAGTIETYTTEISIPEDVPPGFPINLQVTETTRSSMHVTWEPPPQVEPNGKVIYYMVMYGDINSQQSCTNKTTETQMTIHGLSPKTTYNIRVQAYTSKGAGPLSPSIQSKTMSQGLLSSWLSFLHDTII